MPDALRDNHSGLLNDDYFRAALPNRVATARRVLRPISVGLLALSDIGEIETDAVFECDNHEVPERFRVRQVEQFGEKLRGLLFVACGDDGVVEAVSPAARSPRGASIPCHDYTSASEEIAVSRPRRRCGDPRMRPGR